MSIALEAAARALLRELDATQENTGRCAICDVAPLDYHEPDCTVVALARAMDEATAAQAKAAAERALDACRDDSVDGWSEDVTGIAWGEIRGHVVETFRKSVEEYDAEGDKDAADSLRERGQDYVVDYELVTLDKPAVSVEATLSRLSRWCKEHGASLCPTPGRADSFGDGMREAKRQIAEILAAGRVPVPDPLGEALNSGDGTYRP